MSRLVWWLGPLGAAGSYAALAAMGVPESDRPSAMRLTLAVFIWMALWWLTEVVPMSTTALLPLVAFPILGIRSMAETASAYAHPLIFLFLGGFLVALTMQRWHLDRRFALLTLTFFGGSFPRALFGFMLATALLSAFVSNTATTAMMLPIALSAVRLASGTGQQEDPNEDQQEEGKEPPAALVEPLLLGIAYAATIGGMATLIGTPPNAFLAGFIEATIAPPYRRTISFVRWLAIGLPVAAVLLPVAWWWLTSRLGRGAASTAAWADTSWLAAERAKLGPITTPQRRTLAVFAVLAILWIVRPWLAAWTVGADGGAWQPLGGLTDGGLAMSAAVVLLLVPSGVAPGDGRKTLLDWPTALRAPWDILLLFGGGLALAKAVQAHGVSAWIGQSAAHLAGLPSWLIILLVTVLVVFLTELTSNLATTAALLPVLAAGAASLDLHPYQLLIPATLGASCAFMMPVATPPNALVFATGRLRLRSMQRAGWWLNGASIVCVTVWAIWGIPWVLGGL